MAKKKVVKKIQKKTAARPATAGTTTELASLADLMGMNPAEWAGTEAAKSGGRAFDVGNAQTATISEVNISDKIGSPQISYLLKGTGEAEGRSEWKNDGLKSAAARGFARREMEAVNLVWPDDPNALGEAVAPAEGLAVIIDVKADRRPEYKDEYTNIYFRDVVDGTATEETVADDAPDEPQDDEGAYTAADLDALGTAADAGDGPAIDELTGVAGQLDLVPDDFETWEDLANRTKEDSGL